MESSRVELTTKKIAVDYLQLAIEVRDNSTIYEAYVMTKLTSGVDDWKLIELLEVWGEALVEGEDRADTFRAIGECLLEGATSEGIQWGYVASLFVLGVIALQDDLVGIEDLFAGNVESQDDPVRINESLEDTAGWITEVLMRYFETSAAGIEDPWTDFLGRYAQTIGQPQGGMAVMAMNIVRDVWQAILDVLYTPI